MMNNNILKIKRLLLVSFVGVFSLFGCNNNEEKKPDEDVPSYIDDGHVHTFSDEYVFDKTYHWHPATCEHKKEVSGKEPHIYSDWVIDKEPSITEMGHKHRDCLICDYVEEKDIDKTNHLHNPGDPVKENVVEPGCTTKGGYDMAVYCTICLEELSREHFETDPIGHHLVHVDAQEATCTEEGWDEYDFCDNEGCDYSTEVIIPATNHPNTHVIDEDVVEPTCTEDGHHYENTYCDDCGELLDSHYYNDPAHGHDYWSPTYEWSIDHMACVATHICKYDESHIESENGEVTYEDIEPATPSSDGIRKYTATFINSDFETQEYIDYHVKY